jgi:CDP-glycerol glycerophosphotransferase
MGIDINSKDTDYLNSKYDVFFAQSQYDINIFSSAFNIPRIKFVLAGLPRNDELYSSDENQKNQIKIKLNIPLDKKVILYAPTFREYKRNINGCIGNDSINIEKWKKELYPEYIILFREHYEINSVLENAIDGFVKNVSEYPNLNELMLVSDILISDYSSIMFDFSILNRPIYSYAYDYDEYKEKRGMYIDIEKELPNGIQRTEIEILEEIKKCDFIEQVRKTRKFSKKYIETDGNAVTSIDKFII